MMLKYLIGISLVLILVNTGHASAENPFSFVTISKNKFSIENVSIEKFYSGEMQLINITIRNNWKFNVKDVYATLSGDENVQINDAAKKSLGRINSSELKTISYLIVSNADAKSGIYTLKLNILWTVDIEKYQDSGTEVTGGDFSDTLEFGIYNVGRRLSNIGIFNITINPKTVTPGSIANLNFDMINNAKKPIENIKFRLFLKPPFRYATSQMVLSTPQLDAGQTTSGTYYILTDTSAVEGTYELQGIMEYSMSDSNFIEDYNFNVNIIEGTPLQIERIEFNPLIIRPETDGQMIIELKNSGKSVIRDVTIVSYGGEGILKDVYKYAGSILPNQSKITTFAIYTDETTKLTTRGVNIDISYTDSNGNNKNISRIIPIQVIDSGSIIPSYITVFMATIVLMLLLVSAVFILYYGRD